MAATRVVCQPPVLGDLRSALGAGRELDVGLTEQRLLAQDRAAVLGQGRVLVLQLDGRVGAPVVAEIDLLDPADVDPGDPHVGFLGELRGLGEIRVEAVAVGLQRHRPAECGPQEQQQAEAGQREDRHHEEPADCRDLFLHGLAIHPHHLPQISALLGKFVRAISVPSWLSIFATFSSAPAATQSVMMMPRLIGPLASWVE